MMCEVPLSRFEELLLGVARELRPALAVGDPAVPFRDRGHVALVIAADRHLSAPPRASDGDAPVSTVGKILASPLSIRFQNVAVGRPAPVRGTRIQLCGRLSVEIDGAQVRRRAARPAGAAAARLPAAEPRSLRRARGADRRAVARPGAALAGRGAADAAVAPALGARQRGARGPRRADPRPARARCGSTSRRRSSRSSALSRRSSAATRAAPGRWRRCRSTSPAAGCCPASQARWLEPRRRELEDIRLQALEVIGRAGLRLGGTQLASVERAARAPDRGRAVPRVRLRAADGGAGAAGQRRRGRCGCSTGCGRCCATSLGRCPRPRRSRPTSAAAPRRARRGAAVRPVATPTRRRRAAGRAAPRARRRWSGAGASWPSSRELWRRATAARARRDIGRADRAAGRRRGIGKTSLAAELAAARARGRRVRARRPRARRRRWSPYQPFLEALRHYVAQRADRRAASDRARVRLRARAAGPRAAPPRAGAAAAASPAEPETERYRLFEAVVGAAQLDLRARAGAARARRPAVGRPARRCCCCATSPRARDPARLLILGAYRATEATAEGFADALAELRRERLIVTQIDVGGLAEPETAELVRMRTGEAPSQAFAHALHERDRGQPVVHRGDRAPSRGGRGPGQRGRRASSSSGSGLPEGVKQVIARRLGRLERPDDRVAAGGGGDRARLRLCAARARGGARRGRVPRRARRGAGGRAGARVPARTRALQLLARPDPRDAVRGDVGAARGRGSTAASGEALEAGRAATGAGSCSDRMALAHHFTRAAGREDVEKAIDYARRAGEQATKMLAHEEAAEQYARALEVLDRFEPEDARSGAASCCCCSARPACGPASALARDGVREAAELAERLGDSVSLARAAIGASRRYIQQPGVVETEADRAARGGRWRRPRASDGDPRAAAGAAVRRDLLLARARPDAARSATRRRRSRRSSTIRRQGACAGRAPPGAVGRRPSSTRGWRPRPRC